MTMLLNDYWWSAFDLSRGPEKAILARYAFGGVERLKRFLYRCAPPPMYGFVSYRRSVLFTARRRAGAKMYKSNKSPMGRQAVFQTHTKLPR